MTKLNFLFAKNQFNQYAYKRLNLTVELMR